MKFRPSISQVSASAQVGRAQVVVIGGGIAGVSAAYHLCLRGWTDVVLLERDELTSGSTWHAAGNVPTFSTGWSVMRLQQYSADLYRRLASDADSPLTYHVTGSVRLAHTRERMAEFMHIASMARANGMEYEVLSPSRARGALPVGADPRPRRSAVGSARRRHRSVPSDASVGHSGTSAWAAGS